jgi:hypothetical protein
MPPRRSARVADAAERATTALSPLPLAVVLHIFSLLPVDDRLRCSEVCRGWRSVLLERSLWTRLDLLRASGVRVREGYGRGVLDALLRCASARARGGLQSLSVDADAVSDSALLAVAAANAGALQELQANAERSRIGFVAHTAAALLRAAPLLRVLAADLYCDEPADDREAACRALRNEAPFGPLRVRHLYALLDDVDEADVNALTAEVAAHAWLTGLTLHDASLDAPAALDAVVDAALARRMQAVHLTYCDLAPDSAPAVVRLLGGGALTSLKVEGEGLLDAPSARVLAAALRANATLTSLTLEDAALFNDVAAASELLGALNAHTSVRVLNLGSNSVAPAHTAVVGALLGALVAANTAALTELDVSSCLLGDDGMRPLFEALPANTHLRALGCAGNHMSEAFVRDVVLPAVRANASLRNMSRLSLAWYPGAAIADADNRIAREPLPPPPPHGAVGAVGAVGRRMAQ